MYRTRKRKDHGLEKSFFAPFARFVVKELSMTPRIITSAALLALAIGMGSHTAPVSGQSPAGYAAPRTPWGEPDIQGLFTTDDELGVPFERPEAMGTRATLTDAELRDREAQAARQAAADAEEFVAPRAAAQGAGGRGGGPASAQGSGGAGRGGNPEGGGGVGPPGHWLERAPRPSRRTSIVIDPTNGRIPFLNDEARRRAAVAVNARTSGQKPYDGPEALDLYDRCITRGLPHVIFPTIYNNTSQIVQGPGYVAIRYEMIHDTRIIPINGGPHLPSSMKQYFGDSRGRWEGDALVVDVTNFPSHIINYRGAGPGLRLTERFRRISADTVRYEVTVTDSTTFSRPWTAALHLRHSNQPDVFEYACHEGNYAMRNILSGARAAEKQAVK